MNDWALINGDARRVLPLLEPNSVQTCICSPPYLWARNYGHDDEIGAEDTLEEYLANLVQVFRGVKRALTPTGLLWIVIADTYARRAGGQHDQSLKIGAKNTLHTNTRYGPHSYRKVESAVPRRRKMPPGCKQGDLIGVPWQLAFALRQDGWWWRQDVVWSKPDAMPESVKTRCVRSHETVLVFDRGEGSTIIEGDHETVLMFSKRERGYYHDHEAIEEPSVSGHSSGNGFVRADRINWKNPDGSEQQWEHRPTRRKRSIQKGRKRGSQTATYPGGLVEPMIEASTAPGDLVLDPFAGSGTTGEVALRLGRRFIGIELIDANATRAEDYLKRVST